MNIPSWATHKLTVKGNGFQYTTLWWCPEKYLQFDSEGREYNVETHNNAKEQWEVYWVFEDLNIQLENI